MGCAGGRAVPVRRCPPEAPSTPAGGLRVSTLGMLQAGVCCCSSETLRSAIATFVFLKESEEKKKTRREDKSKRQDKRRREDGRRRDNAPTYTQYGYHPTRRPVAGCPIDSWGLA